MIIATLTINHTDWTPVVVTIDCNYVGIRNVTGSQIKIRTDQADANTEDTIDVGVQEVIGSTASHMTHGYKARYPNGTTVCYLQNSAMGSAAIKIRMVL